MPKLTCTFSIHLGIIWTENIRKDLLSVTNIPINFYFFFLKKDFLVHCDYLTFRDKTHIW